MTPNKSSHPHRLTRRAFMSASAVASVPFFVPGFASAAASRSAAPAEIGRKVKLGVVGCGGRGSWIAKLFAKHGGYEMFAVADYFPEVVEQCGDALNVAKERRFSGLSGYQKLIASGVEAVALETIPYFMPEMARAAVAAGCHVYMAKPVAVDVPGALMIEAAGKQATQKRRCFLVDYQMPTDPINIEVAQRVRDGGLGKIEWMATFGFTGLFPDPPLTANLESRLQHLTWVNDIALGCDYIGNYDIHAIDMALWITGQRPVVAAGSSRIGRPDPHGDAHGVCSVVYEFADGLVLNHSGQGLKNNADGTLLCQIYGQEANAQLNYWGKAFVRGGPKHFGGDKVENLYQAGAERNIATFYQNILGSRFENATVGRAVDGVLTTVLGREAAARRVRLTMDELIRENKRLEVDLRGLKS
jgi:myo-inositol 2-dehydrogenase / D-chiro-inositol 1-dehydrogenase